MFVLENVIFIKAQFNVPHLSNTKMELFEYAPQTGGILKRGLCVLVWTGNALKTELFENDAFTIIKRFP